MQHMQRKDPRGQATRMRLVAATQELIAEGGLGAATTRAVTQRAGANIGAVNYHFGSKTALVRVAVAEAVERIQERVFGGPPAVGSFIAGVKAARPLAAGPWARVVLAAAVEGPRDPELADLVRAKLVELRQKVVAVTGVGPADDADDSASGGGLDTLVAAALDGLLLHLVIDPETDVDGAAAALARILVADE
jgi:AcrR family transcriptional regulator